MKSFLTITALVIALAALTGFLLPSVLPYPENAPATTVVERFDLAVEDNAAFQTVAYSVAKLRHAVTGRPSAEALEQMRKYGSATMLLNQPVLILRDNFTDEKVELPKGTKVRLVSNEGRFVRVSHGDRVVTIPRSALVSGIAKTN